MIRLGYVGLNTRLATSGKTFRISSYSEEKMIQYSKVNLLNLEKTLNWNAEHLIKIFRISSGLIPFASHPVNKGCWKTVLKDDFKKIGQIIRDNQLKVSMHPGQYTTLNTPNPNHLQNSLADLDYHAQVLDLMELDFQHRIVIHGGGGYGDKEKSMNVLVQRINDLPTKIHRRLALENDEKVFNAKDILSVSTKTHVPSVLDIFHQQILPSLENLSLRKVILLHRQTWGASERQEIHYSNQDPKKNKGAHSEKINLIEFKSFYRKVKDLDLDIMLEVKDKQESVLLLRQHFPQLQ
jgi:UV DNA damage endonuclease